MNTSVHTIINGNKHLIICFGGMASRFYGIHPFEFLNYLSKTYSNVCDLYFLIDRDQCWYHKGIYGITKNIDETIVYLDEIILKGNYDKVLFMGTSAGGYGAILFGSLCKNVNCVISFVPQTILNNPIDVRYKNIKNVLNDSSQYIIHGDVSVSDEHNVHHISHCENINVKKNVQLFKHNGMLMKQLRDAGIIKKMIDSFFFGV
jgi:hypothetical protein